MIPGAWNTRAVAPPLPATAAANPQSTRGTQGAVVSGRERLERELEGGGAPRERARRQRFTFLTRLWRTTLHPTRIGAIWSRDLPQPL